MRVVIRLIFGCVLTRALQRKCFRSDEISSRESDRMQATELHDREPKNLCRRS